MYRAGIKIEMTFSDSTGSFLDYYIALHGKFLENFNGDRVPRSISHMNPQMEVDRCCGQAFL